MKLTSFALALAPCLLLAGCATSMDEVAEEQTASVAEAVVKGGDLPGERCVCVRKDGTLVSGACDVVCKDKTVYEPDTDAEVDALGDSNGGVCKEAARVLVDRRFTYTPSMGFFLSR